jgi:hypothetical protein
MAVACYLAPSPLKGVVAHGRGAFVQHHLRQAAGLSFLLVGLVLLLVVFFFFSTGFWLLFEQTAQRTHFQDRLNRLALGLGLLWLIAWASGILLAAAGSHRHLPVAARLGNRRGTYCFGMLGGSILALLAVLLGGLAVHAQGYARPLGGAPAALYLLYDDAQAARWVVTLLSFPMNRAANRRWGSGSVVVAPVSRQSLREALAQGKIVYLATHGVNGPLLYREGSLGPQDVAQGMKKPQREMSALCEEDNRIYDLAFIVNDEPPPGKSRPRSVSSSGRAYSLIS